MNLDQQRLRDYLAHIVEATQRINQYTEDVDEHGFLNNALIQDAVIRNIEIIGEASNNILKKHPNFTQSHPQIPFLFAYEMRNAEAHGYFKVDLEIVWKTIKSELPVFERQVKEIMLTL